MITNSIYAYKKYMLIKVWDAYKKFTQIRDVHIAITSSACKHVLIGLENMMKSPCELCKRCCRLCRSKESDRVHIEASLGFLSLLSMGGGVLVQGKRKEQGVGVARLQGVT